MPEVIEIEVGHVTVLTGFAGIQAGGRARGWRVAPSNNRSLTTATAWLLGNRDRYKRFYCPVSEACAAEGVYGHLLDHIVKFIDKDGEKIIACFPYLRELPKGFKKICTRMGIAVEWHAPNAVRPSWYGNGTATVFLRRKKPS